MPRALVTGATGYVGSCLVTGLVRKGWDVSIVMRPSSSVGLLSSVLDKIAIYKKDDPSWGIREIVGNAKPDVIFHLASMVVNDHSQEDIRALVDTNITFGTELLDAMVSHGVTKIVSTGTHWEHFDNSDYSPVNLYAATKHAFQNILQYYTDAKGISAINLKLFDPYGPNDPRPKLLNLLMETIQTGKTLAMSYGEQKIDLVYIDDVVNAYIISAKRLIECRVAGLEVYGVGTGQSISIKDLVAMIEQVIGRPLNIEWGARPYRAREVLVPWSKGRYLPGWKVSKPLITRLHELMETRDS
ncbi:MAG: NAD-dependent epimerase/dehydratase family protein [Candidatus Thiodiazotropha sp.]|jgi:nucleoside-diphosphate-sugar epimerase